MPRRIRYRGKRRLASVLSAIGITVLVVSVLGGTAYLFLRKDISLTEDGLFIKLPFFDRSIGVFSRSPEAASPEPDEDDEDIVLVVESTPTPPATPAPEPSPSPSAAPAPENPAPKAVFLRQADIGNAARMKEIADMAEEGVIDTVVIEVKTVDGDMAAKARLEEAAATLTGFARVAGYISVLEDNTVTRSMETFAIKHTSGVNWLDFNRSRWINPYVPEARAWLVQRVSEYAEIFDALLLDRLWFPTDGRFDAIGWGEYEDEPRGEILNLLLDEIRAAAFPVPCWAVIEPTGSEHAGQDAEYLQAVCEFTVVDFDGFFVSAEVS